MKPRSFTPLVAAVLLFLPLLYVGSYLALVTPGDYYFGPTYRFGGSWSQLFFWPLEQIDRRVRPLAWESPWDQPVIRSGTVGP